MLIEWSSTTELSAILVLAEAGVRMGEKGRSFAVLSQVRILSPRDIPSKADAIAAKEAEVSCSTEAEVSCSTEAGAPCSSSSSLSL
jgi:hypothetical protein